MGKKLKTLGVKRKRGKKFEWKEENSMEIKKKITSKSLFRDKRLGEKNFDLNKEQKYLLRFQRERDFLSRRKQRFELDETIELTHKGIRLEDLEDDYVEDYDIDISDDESKPKKIQRMDDDLVLNHHFGDGSTKSKKDVYEELIHKSKQNKLLRQQEKEENIEITRKLDGDLTDISQRLKFKTREKDLTMDDYDNLLLEIRDDIKIHAELGKDNIAARQLREQLEEKGEDWKVPDKYKEFVVKVRENPIESIYNMKYWTDCDTKKEKQVSQERLLEYTLKYLLELVDDNTTDSLDLFSSITQILYTLVQLYPSSSEKLFLSIALGLGKDLNLGVVFFYHLVSLVFPITFLDALTSTLASLAGCYFVEYPLASYKCTRNLLMLAKVYCDQWLQNQYSPEVTRCLQRVIKRYKSEQLLENFEPRMLFESESHSLLHTYAVAILGQQKSIFKDLIGYKNIIEDDSQDINTASPMQLYHKPIQEVATYEPMIFDKIRSNKKNKDLNKEITELDKLRQQSKKAKKIAKKALEKETEVTQHEKNTEYKIAQENNEKKQNYVKNMLDELQVEYKKFDTTLEKKTEKKKRKKRMAGNKSEQST
jgi:Nop14-like family